MSILQALILALFYYLSKGEIYVPFTYSFVDLMMVSLLTGVVLGDPAKGAIVGGTIMPLYLALTSVGGSAPVDKEAAGIVSTACVITQGISLESALVLSSAAALTLSNLHILNRTLMVAVTHKADKDCANGDIKKLTFDIFVLGDIIKLLVFGLPMFVILYWGTDAMGFLLNGLPEVANNILNLMAGMLPALGFAMTVVVIGKSHLLPFFAAGFFFAKYSGLGSIPGLLLGLFLAWLYMVFTKDPNEPGSIFGDLNVLKANNELSDRILDKKDLNRAWNRWRMAICHVDNVERLQGIGVAYTMSAVLPKLYPNNPEQIAEGLSRHTSFFCTENMLGGIIPGILISLEEERAIGFKNNRPEEELVPVELIDSIKVGMMGPFAGMGDTLNYATINPLLNAFFSTFAAAGAIWAPIVSSTIKYIVWIVEGKTMFNLGYKVGTQGATAILQSGAYQKIVTFFSIVGLFVMGVFSSDFVSVQCNIMIPKVTELVSLQEILFDAIAPGILSFATVMLTYLYLKKSGNMLKVTLWMILIAIVFGGLGILAA